MLRSRLELAANTALVVLLDGALAARGQPADTGAHFSFCTGTGMHKIRCVSCIAAGGAAAGWGIASTQPAR